MLTCSRTLHVVLVGAHIVHYTFCQCAWAMLANVVVCMWYIGVYV
jgi:hypothetical protein